VLLLFRPFPAQKHNARETLKEEIEASAAEAIEAAAMATRDSRAKLKAAEVEDSRGKAEVVATQDFRAEVRAAEAEARGRVEAVVVVAVEEAEAVVTEEADRADRRQRYFGSRSPTLLSLNPSLLEPGSAMELAPRSQARS
jgi:hypothetical protein